MNTRERIFDIFFMFFNLGLTSYLLGNMNNLVVHGTARTRKFVSTHGVLEHLSLYQSMFVTVLPRLPFTSSFYLRFGFILEGHYTSCIKFCKKEPTTSSATRSDACSFVLEAQN